MSLSHALSVAWTTPAKPLSLRSSTVRTYTPSLPPSASTSRLWSTRGERCLSFVSRKLKKTIATLSYYSFSLNIWDVGGQKSLRSYWRNYFETTDGLIWVVDSADKRRLDDCKKELHQLLQEEVNTMQDQHTICSGFTGTPLMSSKNALAQGGRYNRITQYIRLDQRMKILKFC